MTSSHLKSVHEHYKADVGARFESFSLEKGLRLYSLYKENLGAPSNGQTIKLLKILLRCLESEVGTWQVHGTYSINYH